MSRHHAKLDRKEWGRVRRWTIHKDNYRCRLCGHPGGPFEVDHIVPLERGGAPYDFANTQTLCPPCHFRKTADENRRELTPAQAEWRDAVQALIA